MAAPLQASPASFNPQFYQLSQPANEALQPSKDLIKYSRSQWGPVEAFVKSDKFQQFQAQYEAELEMLETAIKKYLPPEKHQEFINKLGIYRGDVFKSESRHNADLDIIYDSVREMHHQIVKLLDSKEIVDEIKATAIEMAIGHIEMCTTGVRSNTRRALDELKLAASGKYGLLQKARQEIALSWASDYAAIEMKERSIGSAEEVHVVNCFYDSIASQYGLERSGDLYADLAVKNRVALNTFKKDMTVALSPFYVLNRMSEMYYSKFVEISQQFGLYQANNTINLDHKKYLVWSDEIEKEVLNPLGLICGDTQLSLFSLLPDAADTQVEINIEHLNVVLTRHIYEGYSDCICKTDDIEFKRKDGRSVYTTNRARFQLRDEDDALAPRVLDLNDLAPVDLDTYDDSVAIALVEQACETKTCLVDCEAFIQKHLMSSKDSFQKKFFFKIFASLVAREPKLKNELSEWLIKGCAVGKANSEKMLSFVVSLDDSDLNATVCNQHYHLYKQIPEQYLPTKVNVVVEMPHETLKALFTQEQLGDFFNDAIAQNNLDAFKYLENLVIINNGIAKNIVLQSICIVDADLILPYFMSEYHPDINHRQMAQENSGYTPLMIACENNSPKVVKVLLSNSSCNPNMVSSDGKQALHIACEQRHTNVVKTLLEFDSVVPFTPTSQGITSLQIAIISHNFEIIKMLLDVEKNALSKADKIGLPIYIYVGKISSEKVLRFVLESYIDEENTFDLPYEAFFFKLWKVVLNNNPSVAHVIVEFAAKLNNVDKTLMLSYAIENKNLNAVKAINKYLRPIDVTAKSKTVTSKEKRLLKLNRIEDKTVLTTPPLEAAFYSDNIDILLEVVAIHFEKHVSLESEKCKKLILEYESGGLSFLHKLSGYGSLNIIKELWKQKIISTFSITAKGGNTSLHLAVLYKKSNVISFIIEHDPDVLFMENKCGETPLIYAMKGRYPSVAILSQLLQYYDAKNKHVISALKYAIGLEDLGFISAFSSLHIDVYLDGTEILSEPCTPLPRSVLQEQRDLSEVASTLGSSTSVATRNSVDSSSIFQCALETINVEVIISVLSLSNYNINNIDEEGNTLAHCLIQNRHLIILSKALNFPNLRVSKKNKNGESIIDLLLNADDRRYHNLLKLLVEGNPPDLLNLTSKNNENLLHTLPGDVEQTTAEWLVMNSSQVEKEAKDNNGLTPLQRAFQHDYVMLAYVFIHGGAKLDDLQPQCFGLLNKIDGKDSNGKMILKSNLVKAFWKSDAFISDTCDEQENSLLHYSAMFLDEESFTSEVEGKQYRLTSNKAGKTPLAIAIELDRPEIISAIMCHCELGGNPFFEHDVTYLQYALKKGKYECAALLLQSKFNLKINHAGEVYKTTALQLACLKGETKVVDLIMNYVLETVNTNILTVKKENIFHLAVKSGNLECVEILLPFCDINLMYENNKMKKSPYILAKQLWTAYVSTRIGQKMNWPTPDTFQSARACNYSALL